VKRAAEGEAGVRSVEEAVALFSRVVREPAFDAGRVGLIRESVKGGIARRNDDPAGVVKREFRRAVYGEKSPYARVVEYSDIRRIDRDAVMKWYQQTVARTNGAFILAVGDFSEDTMMAYLEKGLGDWPGADPAVAHLPVPQSDEFRDATKKQTIFLVDKPELSQAYIRAGTLGGRLDDPDLPALDVFNSILNGLGGRLFNELRSKDGLAYSVSAGWHPGYDHDGLFVGGGETTGARAAEFIAKFEDTLQALDREPPTPEEVEYAKQSTINAFVFEFTSNEDILERKATYRAYGYPEDFAERFIERVARVTPEDVQRVARERIREDDFVYVVVGNQKQLEPVLKTLDRPIEKRSIKIPK